VAEPALYPRFVPLPPWHSNRLSRLIKTPKLHFRDKYGVEVDIVLERGAHDLAGVEVKAGATVTGADFRGLRKLQEATGPTLRRRPGALRRRDHRELRRSALCRPHPHAMGDRMTHGPLSTFTTSAYSARALIGSGTIPRGM